MKNMHTLQDPNAVGYSFDKDPTRERSRTLQDQESVKAEARMLYKLNVAPRKRGEKMH